MITLYRAAYQDNPRASEYAGESTDAKPTENVENGAWFTEIDTGAKYRFDKENQTWYEQTNQEVDGIDGNIKSGRLSED